MNVSSKGTITFAASVKGDYYCHGDHKIWLDFEDIFKVYRKDAIDITLMSVWTSRISFLHDEMFGPLEIG